MTSAKVSSDKSNHPFDSHTKFPISVLLFHPADVIGGAERTSTNIVRFTNCSTVKYVVVADPNVFHLGEDVRFISLIDLGISNGFNGILRAVADARILCAVAKREKCTVALGMLHYGALVVVLMRFLSYFRLKAIASPRTPSMLAIRFYAGQNTMMAFKWRNIISFFCRFANRVVVASEGLKKECVSCFGSKQKAVIVIPNGIDANLRLCPPEAVPKKSENTTFRIVTFGRLAPEKDFDTLFAAFMMVRRSIDSTLWVIGDGPELERLKQLAETLKVAECIEFLGFKSNPLSYLKCCDVFVHSALFEGFGNVILEAMACGVPVVATDCDFGPREIIRHTFNGMLVPVAHPARMAQAIIDLHDNAKLRDKLIQNGYKTLDNFNVHTMAKAYEKTILDIPT